MIRASIPNIAPDIELGDCDDLFTNFGCNNQNFGDIRIAGRTQAAHRGAY